MKHLNKSVVILLTVCMVLSIFPQSVLAKKNNEDGKAYRKGRRMISMGDSFASGESIGRYGTGSVTDEDFLAHRSSFAWSGMLKLPGAEGMMRDNRGTNWEFVACSGATTENLTGTQTKEYNHNGSKGSYEMPPQFDAFKNGMIDPKEVDYVTLSIGGNDVDFSGIIKRAALNGPGFYGFAVDAVTDKLNHFDDPGGTHDKLVDTYRRIAKEAPNATIIVTGYPQLFAPHSDMTDGNYLVNEIEAQTINEGVSCFNLRIKSIIQELQMEGINIEFADVEKKFKGHGAFSDEPWINGIEFGADPEELDDNAKTSMNSIHPNFDGAKAYAECVQEVIDRVEKEKAEKRKELGLDDDGNPINAPTGTPGPTLSVTPTPEISVTPTPEISGTPGPTETPGASVTPGPDIPVPTWEPVPDYGYPPVEELLGTYEDGMLTVTEFYIPPEVQQAIEDARAQAESEGADVEGCDIDMSQIVGQTAGFPFTLSSSGSGLMFSAESIPAQPATYYPDTGVIVVPTFTYVEDEMPAYVTITLHQCSYSNPEHTAIVIDGSLIYEFTGEYKGVVMKCRISGTRQIPPKVTPEPSEEGYDGDG
jgi:hypothetical protein